MIFRQLFEKNSSTYTYLVACEATRQAALIDPVAELSDTYIELLQQLGLRLSVVLDTHSHADHITAAGRLREHTGCITYLGEQAQSPCASQALVDGETIALGELAIQVLYTPGHTDDSYSFVIRDGANTYAFTGDTLLIRGTGRTDFQNGNALHQFASLQKLLQLPKNTWVYPGHDYNGFTCSTLEEEKQHNPRLQFETAAAYAQFMAQLNLPNPKLMDIAVPANRACGQV